MVLVASAARSTAERKPLLGFLIFLSDISMSTPIRPRAPPTHRNHGPFHLASDRKHARPIARILVYPVQVNRAFDGRHMDKDENDRGQCYCNLWVESPHVLEKLGLPRGYCGFCSRCGKPGHLRHAPEGPFTDARCDFHFDDALGRLRRGSE